MDFRRIEEEHPELASLVPFSAEWYRGWRKAHLAKYPDCDRATRANLDSFVADAEAREAELAALDAGRFGTCQHPVKLDSYGLPAATCGAPAMEYRPDREFLRYVCHDHR